MRSKVIPRTEARDLDIGPSKEPNQRAQEDNEQQSRGKPGQEIEQDYVSGTYVVHVMTCLELENRECEREALYLRLGVCGVREERTEQSKQQPESRCTKPVLNFHNESTVAFQPSPSVYPNPKTLDASRGNLMHGNVPSYVVPGPINGGPRGGLGLG